MERENKESLINSPLLQCSEDYAVVLSKCNNEKRNKVIEEVKNQLWLAGPLVLMSVLQFCLQTISLMFVGHLGQLALSGASTGNSFATATGFSLLLGMSCALDTLCGQSNGARQHRLLGILMQRAIFVLALVSIPLAILWANTQQILTLLGQDPEISEQAGIYARFLIPSLFAYGLLQCLNKFLQTQSIVFPMMFSSAITTLVHLFICWILIFKANLGIRGAALANSFSYWINVLLLALYVKFSHRCSKSWTGFSMEAFHNLWSFVKLAVPSAVMVCLESWSFEMTVLLSGLLPNPKLETSVLSICLNTLSTVWMIPVGFSGAISTRASNELGGGRPQMAILAIQVVFGMTVAEGILMGSILIVIRDIWGYAYSNEIEVIKYVASMLPIIAAANFLDGLQCVLSGLSRGCGWQKIGAFVNLGSYYFVGIPSQYLFAFVFHLSGKGLWLGMICALSVQVLSLLTITIRTNWEREAKMATARVHESAIPTSVS